ncbi:MAG: ribosomal protein large subunit ribosomal protein [Candidatus Nomurabacteria bacterium]|nr:ribosomal protein large subunit ribosomal protein [Candidatus Nomurabacteria bacterium]
MKTTIKFTPVNMDERKALDFSSGDVVRVWNKIKESDGKTRLQAFEGMVLARKHGAEMGATFTIRKVTSGVGVERIFPLYSVMIDKIEIVRRSRTRRSKLYYVRDKALRDVRRKLKEDTRVVKKGSTTTMEVAKEEAPEEVAA